MFHTRARLFRLAPRRSDCGVALHMTSSHPKHLRSWQQRAGNALRLHGSRMAASLGVFLIFVSMASGNLELVVHVARSTSNLTAIIVTPEFITLIAVGLIMSVGLPLLSPIGASALTFACMLPVYWMSYRMPVRSLMPLEFSLLTILVLYLLHVFLGYYRETKQKQEVIEVFGQYVPPDLAARVSRDPAAGKLAGETRELSVLFCDVKEFSSHAEQLDPRQLSALLNALLTPMTEVVHRHGGTIDKYMGDAMMAFWGAPMNDPQHAANAVSAGFEILAEVARLGPSFEARGWPVLEVGIGINSGPAHVGNMGSRYRMAYTAIGDVVNLAARLEALTRIFDCPMIVGEATRRAFPAAGYRELGLVKVKGKQELVRVFQPFQPDLDPAGTTIGRLTRHNAALAAYYAQDWDRAEAGFRSLKAANPLDPLYVYYLERINGFRRVSPPPGWRGELRFTVS